MGDKQLGGFGTIGSIFPATWDWHQFWYMTAFLSIILAFMNILPGTYHTKELWKIYIANAPIIQAKNL